MTTKVNTNGQARKSLSEQLDRLDAVLDGLADGINDTVVMAVKEAVGAAVQAVLAEGNFVQAAGQFHAGQQGQGGRESG